MNEDLLRQQEAWMASILYPQSQSWMLTLIGIDFILLSSSSGVKSYSDVSGL